TRRLVLSTQRRFRHCSHCGSLWQLEFLNQTPRTRKLLTEYKQDTAAMRRTLRKYEEFVRSSSIPEDTHDQIAWYSRRASEAALNDKAIGESVRLIQRSFDQSESLHRATRLEELKSDGVKRLVRLTGTADALKVNRLRGNYEEFGGGSSAVLLEGTSRGLGVQVPELDPKTRKERAFWKSGRKPEWVSDFGTDEYGAWCEFQVPRHDGTGAVTQRMRWIKPGEFMMGSPEDEEGRWNDESPQHRVHLTQGLWLADTQVTQELWQAIGKRENPSRFKGQTNPVESVSWKDCQDWIRKLDEHHPTLHGTLPTEAQWEYACRAGSQTASCFGDDPTELAKYGWFHENAKGKTHPVKQLDVNAWGLYDMHGNVWEWCQDWYSDYQTSATSNPTGPAKDTARVVRGGSWDSPARSLRSACRDWHDPGNRLSYLGFRLLSSALVAEPSERAMMPEAEPGTERASSVQAIVKPTEPVGDPLEARFWKSGKKPDWVSAFGKDQYGLWFEFQLPSRWPETQAKNKKRTGTEPLGFVTQRMRWIKAGTCTMGSDARTKKLWLWDETQHEVTLPRGFWIADTPCTQGLWIGVVARWNPSQFKGFSNPVERVSWEGCQAWLKKLGDNHPFMQPSLPTEAQWEYACRAGSTSSYCFGDQEQELEKYAWFNKNSGGKTHPVGEKLPNKWGLYDLHGNVWEWCQDWYENFTKASVTDSVGPVVGSFRVIRGGSWHDPARGLRTACRGRLDPGFRDDHLGFRLLSSALVAEPNERAMLPEVEQGTERARIGSAEPMYEFLRSVDLDATGNRSPEEEFTEIDVNAYTSIRVVSDQEGYQFDQLEKPDWAVDFGRDTYGLHATFEVNSVRQRMRWIPPGRFIMGSAEGKDYGRGNEGPEHEVIITHGYWMFDTPCTQGLWTALMGDNPSYFLDPERPVEQVSWDAAVGFANKLNARLAKDRPQNNLGLINSAKILQFRLPTEAEWEYACRAGTKLDTYVGDLELKSRDQTKAEILDSIAWYGGNSGHDYDLKESEEMTWLDDLQAWEKFGGTRKAAQKAANPWGLYNMLGNVWEWCEDWYGEYSAVRAIDPVGPSEGTYRVVRGGCWDSPARRLRSACRSWDDPGNWGSYLGFRLLSSARLVEQ
ncbi:MAG: formylglycine-generating enzyme family protein, partial [Planctomycetota bacterium]